MLELKNVSKSYDREIFKNLSISFPNKGLVLIVGKSGSGKSTLINLILGLDLDYEGQIIYNNKILNKNNFLSFRRNEIACVFQDYGLVEHYTIKQNLLMSFLSIKEDIKDDKLIDVLIKVGIDKSLNTFCFNLSGGEKQRVALAKAMLIDKNIYLCDEPTGSLDKENGENVFSLLKEISKDRLVICVSHNNDFISKYSDFTYDLNEKKWILEKEDFSIGLISNSYEEKKVSLINKFSFSVCSLLHNKVRTIVSIIACMLVFLVMILSLSLSNSMMYSFNDCFTKSLNYNMLEVSNVYQTSNNNSFSVQKMVRPDKQVLTSNLSDYDIKITYNFEFLFSGCLDCEISFKPYYYLENTNYSYLLDLDVSYLDVFVNKSAYDLIDKKIELKIQKSIKTEDYHYNKAIDNIDISLSLNVKSVIDEFDLFETPVIYYNYGLMQNYLSNIRLENASILLNRKVSLYDRFSSLSSDNEELTSYSLVVWLNDNDVSDVRNYLIDKGYDVISICLDNKDYFVEVIEIIQSVINLFLAISLIIVFLLIGIIVYSMIIDRKREIVLLKINGINNKQISKIISFDTILISVFSSLIVLIIINPINKILNYYILKFFNISNFLFIDYQDAFLLVLIAYLFGILFSKVPLFILFKKKEIELVR